MKVLVACEYSGIVRDAFIKAGHDAVSCDLLPTEREGPHIQGDVLAIDLSKFDMVIAHPPCTYLANSGVRWRVERQEWPQVEMAALFFRRFIACAPLWAVENPVVHKHAGLPKSNFTVQPWQFGDPVKKRVCFWTNLPPLRPTHPPEHVKFAKDTIHRMAPGPERQKERSRFFPGLASAMAYQWSKSLAFI